MNDPLSDLSSRFTSSRTPGVRDDRPLHKRKRLYAGGFGLVLVGAVIGAGGGEDTAQRSLAPRPTVTVTETAMVFEPGPVVTVDETAEPEPAVTVTETVEVTDSGYGSSASDDSGAGGSVYYENCAAVRAAGAAPVRRGEPGYGSHLDRDNDGTGCDWG
ncbi:excalibur calcium-binding domain-containing protein [Streptomyces sp. NPDC054844]